MGRVCSAAKRISNDIYDILSDTFRERAMIAEMSALHSLARGVEGERLKRQIVVLWRVLGRRGPPDGASGRRETYNKLLLYCLSIRFYGIFNVPAELGNTLIHSSREVRTRTVPSNPHDDGTPHGAPIRPGHVSGVTTWSLPRRVSPARPAKSPAVPT